MRSVIPLLLWLGVGGLGLMLSWDLVERAMIYFPSRHLVMTPADVGLSYQDVSFVASDGVELHGWFIPGRGRITWLWFHGNAGNISHRVADIRVFHEKLGVTIFIFDYRGYGRSGGAPSEAGIYRDAEAALATLHERQDVNPDALVYFGRSLGAAAAIELAVRRPPRGLVVEGVFASIPAMARHVYPFLPVWPLVRTHFDSLNKIERVEAPLLAIHAELDEVVPLQMGRRIFEAAGEPKRFVLVPEAHHNDTTAVGGQDYLNALKEFHESLFGLSPTQPVPTVQGSEMIGI